MSDKTISWLNGGAGLWIIGTVIAVFAAIGITTVSSYYRRAAKECQRAKDSTLGVQREAFLAYMGLGVRREFKSGACDAMLLDTSPTYALLTSEDLVAYVDSSKNRVVGVTFSEAKDGQKVLKGFEGCLPYAWRGYVLVENK